MEYKKSAIVGFPKLFNQAFGDFKPHIVGIAFLSLLNSIFEGVGISTIIPLFSFITRDGAKGTDIISRTIESLLNFVGINYSLRNLFLFIVVLFIAKIIVLFATKYLSAYVAAVYQRDMKISLFGSILRSNWENLSKQKIGHLDQIMTRNLEYSASLFFVFCTVMLVFAKLIIYSIIAIKISSTIALIAIAVGLVSILFFKPFFYKTKKISEEVENLNRNTSHYINENVIGMKTVKSGSAESKVLLKAKKYFERTKQLSIKYIIVQGSTDVFIQLIGVGFILAIFAYIYKTSVFDFAAFAVVVYAINQIFLQIQAVQTQLHKVTERIPYLSKALEHQNKAQESLEKISGLEKFSFKNNIEFKSLSFAYDINKKVLDSLNFEIKKGEMIGLVGPSGAGKTTIVDLLLRFYNPISGEILIDKKPISDINLNEWRNSIGYVSQDMFLMSDSIENNIRFYNSSLTKKDIDEAAKQAQIYDFVQTCSKKFNTSIGERGILLSAGQRQRIIIARVLARKPKFLILDEATSALDNESEVRVQKIIEDLKGDITVLVIAHRLSTVMNADKLVILENGKITESGSPKELLANKKSYFAKTYNLRV